jgi:hypothetical protein
MGSARIEPDSRREEAGATIRPEAYSGEAERNRWPPASFQCFRQ